MTLLELLNANDRYARSGGMRIKSLRSGLCVSEMRVGENHLNGAGVCQGGALFTLADLAVAGAMNSCGYLTVGIENTVTFHHSAVAGDCLEATAQLTFDHAKIPFCKVEVRNASSGELIASGTSLGYRKGVEIKFDSLMQAPETLQ